MFWQVLFSIPEDKDFNYWLFRLAVVGFQAVTHVD